MMRIWGEPPHFVSINAAGMTIEELQVILSIWENRNVMCGARGDIERWIAYKQKQRDKSTTVES
jgi:hypothetical protein